MSKFLSMKRLGGSLSAPLVVILLFFLALGSLWMTGKVARVYSPGHTIYTVDRPEDAFIRWRDLGLKGRIVLYFDRHLKLDDNFDQTLYIGPAGKEHALPPADSNNFFSLALYLGIFRKVYHIVPDHAWAEVQRKLTTYPFVAYNGRQFRFTIEGIPVIVTRLEDVPSFPEKTVMYLNATYQRDYDPVRLQNFLEDAREVDVVVIGRDGD